MTLPTSARSERGFKCMKTRPVLAPAARRPPDPTEDMNSWTAGSSPMIFATAFWCRTMLSKEMSWEASVMPKMRPVSWAGIKSLGMMMKR